MMVLVFKVVVVVVVEVSCFSCPFSVAFHPFSFAS